LSKAFHSSQSAWAPIGRPLGLAPDEIAVVPGWPSGHTLVELGGAMVFERCDELGWERDRALALVGFQFGEP